MLETKQILSQREGERGNVLFLILIAVALFAALSYAVTQSSRSGGGDANSETNLINSAQITQYPSSVRTSIIRMMVSNSIDPVNLEFNSPSDFGDCSGAVPKFCVFHPDGGGATYVPAAAEVTTTNQTEPWIYNGENEIDLVGTTVGGDNPDEESADIIAFLPHLQRTICARINEELGIDGIPVETNVDVTIQKTDGVGLVSNTNGGTIGAGNALSGQAFGCFQQGTDYYYYHVLIEQ